MLFIRAMLHTGFARNVQGAAWPESVAKGLLGITTGQTPELASMLLIGTGLVAFGGMLRRRKSTN